MAEESSSSSSSGAPDDAPETPSSSSSAGAESPGERSPFNQRQLEIVEEAEHIAEMCRHESYRTVLADRAEITAPVVATMEDLCGEARTHAARAIQKDTREALAVELDGERREQVKAILHRLQSAAKQKYARRNPSMLGNFFIGARLDANQATLHQAAFAVALLLTPPEGTNLDTAEDRLPGVTLEEINTLRGLIELPLAPLGPMSSSSSSSSSTSGGEVEEENDPERALRDALVEEINDRKMEIQFAVEGLYPSTDPLNAEARRDFLLPAHRPFSG
jgi:hypothetical protein